MKYKKRSLKKKQRQRHHFSKKYAQHGGGFMDAIADINAMEGRTNTCMAVHPTQPLVAVGDDAGTVTLWEINQPQPKRVAQLMGLPQTVVKCVEFHKTFPLVAAACNDMVLMWRFDQINREQQDQQVQSSHTVSDFRARNETEVQKELSETKIILEENDRNIKPIFRDQVTIENNLRDIKNKITAINEGYRQGISYFEGMADRINTALKQIEKSKNEEKLAMTAVSTVVYMTESARRSELDLRKQGEEVKKQLEPLRQQLKSLQEEQGSMEKKLKELSTLSRSITEFITEQEKKKRELERELGSIRANARYEVSCIAFHPGSVYRNISYIAVGVNNDKNKNENRIIMYRFEIEPSSVEKIDSIRADSFYMDIIFPDVSLASFSHDGMLFAFVTKLLYGGTVLKVMIFNGSNTNYHSSFRVDKIDQHATSIMSYKSSNSGGGQYQHQFIIGCGNGSLLMTQATTVTRQGFSETKLTNLARLHVWNAGEPIKCVAVHPSLPLFASGTRDVAKLWNIDQPEPLESLDLDLQDVISVGFNQEFLAACGPRRMRFYSCNSDDYGGFMEESHKNLKIAKFVHKLNRQGDACPICTKSMNDPSKQPKEDKEVYLTCGHKFHKECIDPWIKSGRPCPLCRAPGGLAQATPPKFIEARQERAAQQAEQGALSVIETLQNRSRRFFDFGQGTSAAAAASQDVAASETEPAEPELTPEQLRAARLKFFSNPPNGSQGQGGKRNKLKKTKKTKIRNRNYYSKKYRKY